MLPNIPDDQIHERKELTEIVANLDSHLNHDNWQRFQLSFEAVHNGFIQILSETHPELSPAEIKLSIFLKLGMNTKDISNLLYLAPESVKVARSRLRKKMGLSLTHNLQSYLSAL